MTRIGTGRWASRPVALDREEEIAIMTSIAGSTVLVTGANRGIGSALVEEALARGAGRVYAGTRRPWTHADERVLPLTLDVTSAAQIQAAASRISSLDVLVNNAGIALYDDLTDRTALERHPRVHPFRPFDLPPALLPPPPTPPGPPPPNPSPH